MVKIWIVPLTNTKDPLDVTCILCQTKEIANIQSNNIINERRYFPISEPIRLNVCKTKFNILMNTDDGYIWDNNLMKENK